MNKIFCSLYKNVINTYIKQNIDFFELIYYNLFESLFNIKTKKKGDIMKENELNLVGPSFEELSLDEMIESQGSGDVKAQSTIACVGLVAAESSAECASAAAAVAMATYSFFADKC